ncbi:cytochrome b [Serratia sp. AKBS12]|uniref:cytochrome b n=1 Tax=Serratia sp. AKBS12 TaxID=2974597 RepID=UPI0021651775|nr:cytochrome b/b6 domain-containing protein [Serratia sp. AKBS12]MCS3407085.1 cytochrome b/b6 domain-containing protein [Serratia sp. AKBS12]
MSQLEPTRTTYDRFSKVMHWLVAIIIIYATCMGYLLHALEGTAWFDFFSELNMSLGTLALPVMLVRFIWRFFRPSVAMPDYISPRKKQMIALIHEVFYLVIFLVLISGFLMLTKGFYLFWILYIPQPVTTPEVNDFFFKIHRIGCITLGIFMIAHIGAVFNYLRQGKKEILKKMT